MKPIEWWDTPIESKWSDKIGSKKRVKIIANIEVNEAITTLLFFKSIRKVMCLGISVEVLNF